MLDDLSRHTKIEKEKAQQLRKSRWWQNLIQSCECYYCHQPLNTQTATMDHILPVSRGGHSTKGNVVPCCKNCNNKKKDFTPLEWDEYIKGKI